MAFAEIVAGGGTPPPEEWLTHLNSAWEEEISEILQSARQPPRNLAADPDWQAASHFLLRHCREVLSGRCRGRLQRRATGCRWRLSSKSESWGAASVRPPNRKAL